MEQCAHLARDSCCRHIPSSPQVINDTHENPAYMPGIDLGSNVVATPDLSEAVKGADAIVLCVPHQFVHG